MKKRILSGLVLMVLVCSVIGTSFAGEIPTPPKCNIHIFNSKDTIELLSIFDQFIPEAAPLELTPLYKKLGDEASQNILAMMFEAVDTPEQAALSPYADYVTDFVLTSDKEVEVYLVGAYGGLGLVLGPVHLEPNKPFQIMKYLADAAGMNWNWTYSDIVSLVGTFYCGVIVISDPVLKAADELGIVLPELTDLEKVIDYYNGDAFTPIPTNILRSKRNTTFTLSLNLYDDKNNVTVVSPTNHYHYPLVEVPPTTPPKTGDSALPLLWGVAACTSFISMLLLRRRKAA